MEGRKLIRMLEVGRLLWLTALAGGMVFVYCISNLVFPIPEGGLPWTVFVLLTGMTGATVSVMAALDARSRFQEYKKAWDLFFENGFRPKIARLFIHSKCQRDAVRVAARELGLSRDLDAYYRKKGYRWYHILPDFTFKRPGIFLTRRYWAKTFFVPFYQSRYLFNEKMVPDKPGPTAHYSGLRKCNS